MNILKIFKKSSILNIILFIFMSTFSVALTHAKRAEPAIVTPITYKNIKISAPNTVEDMGFIEARDIKSEKLLWKKKIYSVWIIPFIETDVQWVFITELKIETDKLIISNEKGHKYSLNLKTLKLRKQ
jgi:hypothetical protein